MPGDGEVNNNSDQRTLKNFGITKVLGVEVRRILVLPKLVLR
jgi:hypothetical protein